MPRPIYLGFDEEILSLLQKIRKTGSEDVILVIPRGARILKNLTNLKLLREQAVKLKKTVKIATADEHGKLLIQRAGLALTAAIPNVSPHLLASAARESSSTTRPRMGDIVSHRHQKTEMSPQQEEKPLSDKDLSNLFKADQKTTNAIVLPQKKETRFRFPSKIIGFAAVLAAIAVILGVLAFYQLPKAEISVKPRSEPMIRDGIEVLVDSQINAVDEQAQSIPGKKVSQEFSETKTYPVNGTKNVGEKASGFVTIYNFSNTTLILKKATTRLQGSNGKVYYFLQDVGSIRPTVRVGSGAEINPQTLIDPVPIVAAEAGEDSNVAAGTRFEIINEVFGHKPDVLYAINSNPVSGGSTNTVKMLSDADVNFAREDLLKTVLEKYRTQIASQFSTTSRLEDNAFKFQVAEETLSNPVGTEVQNFSMTQKIRINALLYDTEDLRGLIVNKIVRLLPENKYLLPESEQKLSGQFISLDLGVGSGTLKAHFESTVRYTLNPSFLVKSILKKSPSDAKDILLSRPEIEDVNIQLTPFWVKTVPAFENKVIFKVEN